MLLRQLGRTDITISAIGLGCWQFGGGVGRIVGCYWPTMSQETADSIVRAALDGGIDWFDTAEMYGWGESERKLARALLAANRAPGSVVIATKWWPTARRAENIRASIGERLRALAPFPIDLHQVHQPLAFASVAAQMNAMADLADARKIRAVGVSNFSAKRMRRAHEALVARGLSLAANQMRFSLLDRRIERNGVLAAAKELGISILAYSPLAQGILSGKFHENPALVASVGVRRMLPDFRPRRMAQSRPLIDELAAIARAHGATSSQVALSWAVRFHGETVVAIPGATKERHVADNVGAIDLDLSDRELRKLDELSRPFL